MDGFTEYLRFHGARPALMPADVQADDIRQYLSHIAVEERVSSSTQAQALNALVFVFRNVMGKELAGLRESVAASKKRRLPVVLDKSEIKALFTHLEGKSLLMARLMYGTGLRVSECVRLRVKDVDFARRCLIVRRGKGGKDRPGLLPDNLMLAMKKQIVDAQKVYEGDRKSGVGPVYLPDALARKYKGAGTEWHWFWVFPAKVLSTDPRAGVIRRHHESENNIQKQIKRAAEKGFL